MTKLSAQFLVAFFLLIGNVLAARVTYSAKYTGQKVGERTSKNASVDDHKADAILKNMITWSNGAYQASESKHNIILVTNVVEATSKSAASEMVQEMQKVIKDNYVPPSRSPSPQRGESSKTGAKAVKRAIEARALLEDLEDFLYDYYY